MLRFLMLLLLCGGLQGELRAQDSSRADWRRWYATMDSVARCRKLPLLMQFYGPSGEVTLHRTPSGGECQVGPGPGVPTAWVVDSRAFCPDSNPATWGVWPVALGVDEKNLDQLTVTRDSTVLSSLRCPIRPHVALLMKTKRP